MVGIIWTPFKVAFVNEGFDAAFYEGHGGLEAALGLIEDGLDQQGVTTGLAILHDAH